MPRVSLCFTIRGPSSTVDVCVRPCGSWWVCVHVCVAALVTCKRSHAKDPFLNHHSARAEMGPRLTVSRNHFITAPKPPTGRREIVPRITRVARGGLVTRAARAFSVRFGVLHSRVRGMESRPRGGDPRSSTPTLGIGTERQTPPRHVHCTPLRCVCHCCGQGLSFGRRVLF